MSDSTPARTDPAKTDPATIESDIEATRARLAGTVDELAVRLHPKEISRRSVLDLKARIRAATMTPDGKPRVERLAVIGAATLAFIAFSVANRRRRARRR